MLKLYVTCSNYEGVSVVCINFAFQWFKRSSDSLITIMNCYLRQVYFTDDLFNLFSVIHNCIVGDIYCGICNMVLPVIQLSDATHYSLLVSSSLSFD